jgi:hypothetical protein
MDTLVLWLDLLMNVCAFHWCELQGMADESHIVTNCHECVMGI